MTALRVPQRLRFIAGAVLVLVMVFAPMAEAAQEEVRVAPVVDVIFVCVKGVCAPPQEALVDVSVAIFTTGDDVGAKIEPGAPGEAGQCPEGFNFQRQRVAEVTGPGAVTVQIKEKGEPVEGGEVTVPTVGAERVPVLICAKI